jgi:hypothetical protein
VTGIAVEVVVAAIYDGHGHLGGQEAGAFSDDRAVTATCIPGSLPAFDDDLEMPRIFRQ